MLEPMERDQPQTTSAIERLEEGHVNPRVIGWQAGLESSEDFCVEDPEILELFGAD
jgi:hypothetical protein